MLQKEDTKICYRVCNAVIQAAYIALNHGEDIDMAKQEFTDLIPLTEINKLTMLFIRADKVDRTVIINSFLRTLHLTNIDYEALICLINAALDQTFKI